MTYVIMNPATVPQNVLVNLMATEVNDFYKTEPKGELGIHLWAITPGMVEKRSGDFDPARREEFYANLKAYLADVGAVGYVLASEAWMGTTKNHNGPPSTDPARKEIVLIQASNLRGERNGARFAIVRDKKGRVVDLVKESDGPFTGRMANLLELA